MTGRRPSPFATLYGATLAVEVVALLNLLALAAGEFNTKGYYCARAAFWLSALILAQAALPLALLTLKRPPELPWARICVAALALLAVLAMSLWWLLDLSLGY